MGVYKNNIIFHFKLTISLKSHDLTTPNTNLIFDFPANKSQHTHIFTKNGR